jgi:hypothetical protein
MENTKPTASFKIRAAPAATHGGWASIRKAIKDKTVVPEDGEATADELAAERKDRSKAVRRDSLRSIGIMDSLALPFAPPSVNTSSVPNGTTSSTPTTSIHVSASTPTPEALGVLQGEMKSIRVELKEMRYGMQAVLGMRDDLKQVLQLLRQRGDEDGTPIMPTMHFPPEQKSITPVAGAEIEL